jgi:hypothetical protein
MSENRVYYVTPLFFVFKTLDSFGTTKKIENYELLR